MNGNDFSPQKIENTVSPNNKKLNPEVKDIFATPEEKINIWVSNSLDNIISQRNGTNDQNCIFLTNKSSKNDEKLSKALKTPSLEHLSKTEMNYEKTVDNMVTEINNVDELKPKIHEKSSPTKNSIDNVVNEEVLTFGDQKSNIEKSPKKPEMNKLDEILNECKSLYSSGCFSDKLDYRICSTEKVFKKYNSDKLILISPDNDHIKTKKLIPYLHKTSNLEIYIDELLRIQNDNKVSGFNVKDVSD